MLVNTHETAILRDLRRCQLKLGRQGLLFGKFRCLKTVDGLFYAGRYYTIWFALVRREETEDAKQYVAVPGEAEGMDTGAVVSMVFEDIIFEYSHVKQPLYCKIGDKSYRFYTNFAGERMLLPMEYFHAAYARKQVEDKYGPGDYRVLGYIVGDKNNDYALCYVISELPESPTSRSWYFYCEDGAIGENYPVTRMIPLRPHGKRVYWDGWWISANSQRLMITKTY